MVFQRGGMQVSESLIDGLPQSHLDRWCRRKRVSWRQFARSVVTYPNKRWEMNQDDSTLSQGDKNYVDAPR